MAKHQEQFDQQMCGSIEAPSDNIDGSEQQNFLSSEWDKHCMGVFHTKTFQIKTFPTKTLKGDVSELLASRAKTDKTNLCEGVSLAHLN